jgi:hypothetical protein
VYLFRAAINLLNRNETDPMLLYVASSYKKLADEGTSLPNPGRSEIFE